MKSSSPRAETIFWDSAINVTEDRLGPLGLRRSGAGRCPFHSPEILPTPSPKSQGLGDEDFEGPFGGVLTCLQVIWRAVIGQAAQLVGAGEGQS